MKRESVKQRPQPVQIICICPDICAFSVLHHRHLSDICAFCQKCQFEVKKGWQVLLLQSKAEDMHCKQADSAILKLLLVQASMRQIYFISKQTYVVITCFCRNMGYVAFTRILSQIAFCHEYALFWFCFVQTFTQTFRIWLRFCADIWTKNWRLRPLKPGDLFLAWKLNHSSLFPPFLNFCTLEMYLRKVPEKSRWSPFYSYK